ncbi:hypothetical protein EIP86_007188 [Pleurotus ostreatoroseus]|nr:hypothetical protein EIP86_007188 [Pleurotus ostreatoroseus]
MAALAPVPLIPARRPRSPEIIDVDALEDDVLFTGFRRSVRPRLEIPIVGVPSEAGPSSRPQTVIVIDSDDETEPRRRHRLISPPPRRRLPQAPPPPVPPLPSNLATHHHHPPTVVPNPDPLPFEARMHRDHHRHSTHAIPPQPAPPSHHQPAMGLGGALIAINRQNETAERNRRARESAQQRAREIRAQHRWFASHHFDVLDDYTGFGAPFVDDEDMAFLPNFDLYNFIKPAPKSVPWKSSYTHGGDKPPPGFTYQFDMSDQCADEGTSSSKAIVIVDDDDMSGDSLSDEAPVLACACCSEPLVLSESLEEEERQSRKVWGLRCGHMLDGSCIERIMRPPPALETPPQSHQTPWQARRSRKGKGKATDLSHLIPACVEQATGSQQPEAANQPAEADGNSIRSRLRSSRMAAITAGLSAVASSAVSHVSSRFSQRRGATQAPSARPSPRKGRARKPLATHEWKCPVEGCERVHRSVLMPGENWKMDSEEGAVALFV